jgi:uncharacterized protein involved in response to NO
MILPTWTLPDILAKYPSTRSVFDKHGLMGCGGAKGPQETLEFFARVHGLDLDKLLSDLEAAATRPPSPEPYRESPDDVLYRRFFKGAIAVLLTAGATLGAALLFVSGRRHSLTSLDLLPFIQAHANAQVFGWIGLFVMGFAFQGLPRFKYVPLWRPSWARAAFGLMLAALALRTSAPLLPVVGTPVALAGGLLQIVAAALFVTILFRTLRPSTQRDPWDRYVRLSAVLFLVAAMAEPVVTGILAAAPSREALIRRIADLSGPFRDLQVLGFAGLMVFGVGQRILPTAFGFRDVPSRVSAIAFALLAGGLAVDIGAWVAFRTARAPAWAFVSWAGICAYATGALMLAISLRGFTRGGPGRSTKFIRAAFLWLLFACVLAIAQPLYAKVMGLRFSHGYNGAVRHAFTVGFLSLMIVGVSLKVVPILVGADPRKLPALWSAFVLILAGNALRVMSQILTDGAASIAYPLMGVSGAFQVAGFLIWGVHIWKLLDSRPAETVPKPRPARIEAGMTPSDILDWFPDTIEVLSRHGFDALRNPLLKRTLGRSVTLASACAMKRVDLVALLADLNRRIGE